MEALYDPVHISDSPLQSGATEIKVPTKDLEKLSSASDSSKPRSQKFFKGKGMDDSTRMTVWVFTWSEVVNFILQTVGIIAAVVFGIWATGSYNTAKSSLARATTAMEISARALNQTTLANQLSLLTFCAAMQAAPFSNFTFPCSKVTESLLSTVITAVAPPSSAPQSSGSTMAPPPGSTPHSPENTVDFGAIVGTIVAAIVLFVVVGAFLIRKKKLRIAIRIS